MLIFLSLSVDFQTVFYRQKMEVVCICRLKGLSMLFTRETNLETTQIYIKKWEEGPDGPSSERLLTHFPHPHPSIKDLQKEVIRSKLLSYVSDMACACAPSNPNCLLKVSKRRDPDSNVHTLVALPKH